MPAAKRTVTNCRRIPLGNFALTIEDAQLEAGMNEKARRVAAGEKRNKMICVKSSLLEKLGESVRAMPTSFLEVESVGASAQADYTVRLQELLCYCLTEDLTIARPSSVTTCRAGASLSE
jgi:hypothetical protein